MTWTPYQVSLRLLSPMHIGWRKLGNLQQTRPYVTGRTFWGALTARLTRERGESNYQGIGNMVDQQLAFTYFYPSTQPDDVSLWPWGDQWDQFAWTFLGSYASTSLENGRSAEAGSLHETEFIAPYTRSGDPVYLVGYLFQKEERCELEWQGALGKLQLGGERGYAWGRVQLQVPPQKISDNELCFGYTMCNEECVRLKSPQDAMPLLAHTIVSDTDDELRREGAIEPLIGRETKDGTGFGNSHSQAEICWIPGGKSTTGEVFQVDAKGIWVKQKNSLGTYHQ